MSKPAAAASASVAGQKRSAPPGPKVPKKKAKKPPILWTVTAIHFSDDYKCRDGWASIESPRIFAHQLAAEQHARDRYLDEVSERTDGVEADDILYANKSMWKFSDFEGRWRIKKRFRQTLADVKKACDEVDLLRGEYIPVKVEYQVSQAEVIDKEPEPTEDGDTSEEEEESV